MPVQAGDPASNRVSMAAKNFSKSLFDAEESLFNDRLADQETNRATSLMQSNKSCRPTDKSKASCGLDNYKFQTQL